MCVAPYYYSVVRFFLLMLPDDAHYDFPRALTGFFLYQKYLSVIACGAARNPMVQ